MASLSRISFSDQLSVHGTVDLRKESAIYNTRVARILYHSFHSVFLSSRTSGVLDTAGRCAGLLCCSTGSEESKKLTEERGSFWREIL